MFSFRDNGTNLAFCTQQEVHFTGTKVFQVVATADNNLAKHVECINTLINMSREKYRIHCPNNGTQAHYIHHFIYIGLILQLYIGIKNDKKK